MLKQIAWSIVKAKVLAWMSGRALVLPAAKRAEAARRYHVSEDVVAGINAMLIDQAAEELERFKP